MIEVLGNLWEYKADVRVITTNGTVKKNGECVMGRGCAAEAKQMFPTLPYELGKNLKILGNVPIRLRAEPFWLMSFPVKHNWWEKADPELIRVSARLLAEKLDNSFPNDEGHVFVMPRPGCGNGGLRWESVKPLLEPVLDDRFHVITF